MNLQWKWLRKTNCIWLVAARRPGSKTESSKGGPWWSHWYNSDIVEADAPSFLGFFWGGWCNSKSSSKSISCVNEMPFPSSSTESSNVEAWELWQSQPIRSWVKQVSPSWKLNMSLRSWGVNFTEEFESSKSVTEQLRSCFMIWRWNIRSSIVPLVSNLNMRVTCFCPGRQQRAILWMSWAGFQSIS